MCLVRLELEKLPLLSKIMALLFYYIILLGEILHPCASMQYIDHIILAMASSTPITSSSIEIFPSIFFVCGEIRKHFFAQGHHAPPCVLASLCTPCMKLIPTISPPTCHQLLRRVSVNLFPWGISTRA